MTAILQYFSLFLTGCTVQSHLSMGLFIRSAYSIFISLELVSKAIETRVIATDHFLFGVFPLKITLTQHHVRKSWNPNTFLFCHILFLISIYKVRKISCEKHQSTSDWTGHKGDLLYPAKNVIPNSFIVIFLSFVFGIRILISWESFWLVDNN